MESVIWLIVCFLIFWVVTTGVLIWLFLRLLNQQTKQSQLELNRQENLYKNQLEAERTSSTDSSRSARDQAEQLLEQFRESMTEATRAATSGSSSVNANLTSLLARTLPLLTARDAIAAGQLSTITAPAEQETGGAPYTAEDETLASQIDDAMNLLLESGLTDATTARTAAAAFVTAQQ